MSANELYISREGTFGLSGNSFRRRFLVVDPVDINGNTVDPRYDVNLPGLGTGVVGLPGAVAKDYELTVSYGPRINEITVIYDVPTELLANYGGQWQISVDGALDTQRVATAILTPQEIRDGGLPRIIGPYAYKKAGTDDTPTHLVNRGTAKEIKLVHDEGRIEKGADRLKEVVTVTATKRFVGPSIAIRYLSPLGKVNGGHASFGGGYRFAPGSLLYLTASIQQEIGVTGVTPPPFIDDVVRLTFAWSGEGWQHDVAHTWEGKFKNDDADEQVAEYIVTDLNGKAVREIFTLQLTQESFSGMLA